MEAEELDGSFLEEAS